jgi:hypothetical protein
VLGLGLVVAAGLFGRANNPANIAPVTVWVVFWLVLPFLAAVLGNLWSVLNPWSALGRLLGLKGQSSVRPNVLPATVAFLAFTWLELVHGDSSDPQTLAGAALAYTGYLLAWSAVVGTGRAMANADAFTVYHRLLSSIAPFGRDPEGRLRRRGWLRALPVLPRWRGLPLFVCVMIGTVSYDGLSGTGWWSQLAFELVGREWASTWFRTVSLLVVVGAVYGGYLAACWWAARTADESTQRVADAFAHTLVPIGLAYAFAHYFTLVAFEGQGIVAGLSDPFGLGWDLFGTVGYRANYTWLAPTAVWWVQVASIVGGHALGVVLAHDRALAMFKGPRAVRSQYAMLALMVALTTLGLTILAG